MPSPKPTDRFLSRRRGVVALLCLLPGLCAAADPAITATDRQPELYEQAFDVSDRKIPLNRRTPVDVNSLLQLRFTTTTADANITGTAPPDWQRLQTILQQVRDLSAERKALNARARTPEARANPRQFLKDVIRPFNLKANDFIDEVEALLRPGEAAGFQDVLTGDTPGSASTPYENLAAWLTREIERLQAGNRAELAKHQVEVNVSAFLQHGRSETKRIGVPGYDNIAIGNPDPISKTSLKLTAAEAANFEARMKATQEVAALLRQIQDEWSGTNEDLSAALAKLSTQIKSLPRQLRSHLYTINSLGDLRTELEKLAALPDTEPARKEAAGRLIAACDDFEKDVEALKKKITDLTQLYQTLRGGADPALLADLAGTLGKFTAAARNLDSTAADTIKLIEQWGARLDKLQPDIAIIAPVLADRIEPLHDLKVNVTETLATLQPIIDAAKGIAALLGTSSGFDKLPEALAAVQVDEQWFKAQVAPATQIALDSVGLVPGDRVQVKVTYRSLQGDAPPPAPEVFLLDTTQFGLHRKIDASLIFARPLEAPAGQPKRWRPNAAATANWFYRWRPTEDGRLGGGKKIWNFVNPGMGIHAASLAQGDDSVEVGLGLNLSLLDGMLTGGYGYNLSTEDPYVFVGIGLLEVLDRARLPGGNTTDTGK